MTYYIYKTPNNRIECFKQEIDLEIFNELTFVRASDEYVDPSKFVIGDDDEIIEMPRSYAEQRIENYGRIDSQLDKLWHDIDQGVFGEGAKTGCFYQNILAIKQQFPKVG